MVTNLSNGLNQSTSQPEKDNNEVLTQVKAEPVYSDDAYSPDTSNNSCSAVVGSPVLMVCYILCHNNFHSNGI